MNADEQAAFRLAIAREGLKGYEEWRAGAEISGSALADLAQVARWFLEDHAPEAVRPAGERCER
jgi:hypothetical protein